MIKATPPSRRPPGQATAINPKIETPTSSTAPGSLTFVDAFEPVKIASSSPSLRPTDQASRQAAFDALMTSLEVGAQQANITHALTALSHTPGKVGLAAQALLAGGVRIPPTPSGDLEGLKTVVARAIGAVSDSQTQKAAQAMLHNVLTAFRNGSERMCTFGVDRVSVPNPLPPPPRLTPTRGFDEAVAGLRLDDEHSIADLQAYVDARFGRFALTDLIRNGRSIELHHGARDTTMASLVHRGFTQFLRVRTPEALIHNELYVAQHKETGELRYVLTEIWGSTRMGHLQKLLRVAELDDGAGPRKLSPDLVELHSEPLRRPEEIYRRTSRALLASGTVPASVVVGFKAGVLQELGRRSVQAKRLEFVQDLLGKDPAATLLQRATKAGVDGTPLQACLQALGDKASILTENPTDLFRFSERLQVFAEVESALKRVMRAHPQTAALLDDVVGEAGFKVTISGRVADTVPEGAFIDQTVITYFDAEGARRSLLLTRNPYGEIAHELGRVLVDQGVENVFVFGTAGGLQKDDEVGDLHLPTEVLRPLGTVAFENRAVQIATTIADKLKAPMQPGGRVANVGSPVDETVSHVERLREQGATIVEMELGHLVHALKNSEVGLSAIYLVSDVPGTDKTIEKQGHLELNRSLQQAVDVLVEGLGIRSVLLEHDAKPKAVAPWEGAMVLAARALDHRGLAGDDHALLRYVVARYLVNGLSDRAIAALLNDEKACPIQSAALSPRWKEKALRELDKPSKNADVIAHLRALNAELADAVQEMRTLGGTSSNMVVHILGSVVKGRAGLGSDVDTLIETPDRALAERVFGSRFGYKGAPAQRNVVVGDHAYNVARGSHYGPMLSLGDGQRILDDKNALVRVWAEAAARFGVVLHEPTPGEFSVHIDEETLAAASVERDTDPIAERLLEHEKTFRKTMNTDFLLKHLQELEPLADITAVPLERMIHAGELLVRTRLIPSLTAQNVATFVDSPLGRRKLDEPPGRAFLQAAGLADADAVLAQLYKDGMAKLPLQLFIDGEAAAALMGAGDAWDLLTLDFAAAQRAHVALTNGSAHGGEPFAFFGREVRAAQQRGQRAFNNPVQLQAETRGRTGYPGCG